MIEAPRCGPDTRLIRGRLPSGSKVPPRPDLATLMMRRLDPRVKEVYVSAAPGRAAAHAKFRGPFVRAPLPIQNYCNLRTLA